MISPRWNKRTSCPLTVPSLELAANIHKPIASSFAVRPPLSVVPARSVNSCRVYLRLSSTLKAPGPPRSSRDVRRVGMYTRNENRPVLEKTRWRIEARTRASGAFRPIARSPLMDPQKVNVSRLGGLLFCAKYDSRRLKGGLEVAVSVILPISSVFAT